MYDERDVFGTSSFGLKTEGRKVGGEGNNPLGPNWVAEKE